MFSFENSPPLRNGRDFPLHVTSEKLNGILISHAVIGQSCSQERAKLTSDDVGT